MQCHGVPQLLLFSNRESASERNYEDDAGRHNEGRPLAIAAGWLPGRGCSGEGAQITTALTFIFHYLKWIKVMYKVSNAIADPSLLESAVEGLAR